MIGAEQAIAAGYAAFQRKDYPAARAALNGVGHVQAIHLLGLVEKGAGNYPLAAQHLSRAAALDPDNPEIANNRGLLARLMGEFAIAEAAFRLALQLKPDFRSARLSLGQTLKDLGAYETAMDELAILIANQSEDVAALVAFASAAIEVKEYETAGKHLDVALKVNPANVAARFALGVLQLETNDIAGAEAIFLALAQDGQDGAETQFMLARVELEKGHIPSARNYAETAYRKAPIDKYFQLLADIYWMSGDQPSFDNLTDEALGIPALAISSIKLVRQSGCQQAALDKLRQLPDATVQSIAGQSLMSGLLLDLADIQGAIATGRAAARLDENKYDHYNLVNALLAAGEAHEALQLVQRARRKNPSDQFWLAYEVTTLRLLGDERYSELIDYDRHVRTYTLPTPKGFSSLEHFNNDFLAVLDTLNPFSIHPLNQSLRNGGQAPSNLCSSQNPVIKAYFEALDGPIRDYMEQLGRDAGHPCAVRNTGRYKFSGGWSVRLGSGGHHVNHVHPRGWISSSYYVSVPTETQSGEGKAGWIKFGEPPIATAPVLRPEKWIQPRPGLLVLFPSYLWHGTEPIHDGSVRVTAPFDVVPD